MGNDTRTTRPFNHQGPFLLDALICLLFTLLVRVSSSVSGIRKHRTYPLSLVILILGLCIPLSVQALQGSYDTCQEAIALSLNSQEIGILSSSLDQDWYLVTFSPQGRLTASLSSQKNYQLSLYSSCDSNPICTSTNKCIQDPALGTYYLKVHSSGSADDSVYTIGAMFENTAINSDLYIHNIWAADNVVGEIPTEIYWQISNTGSPITQPFVLKFTLDGQTIHSTTIQSISIQEQIAGSFPVTTTIGTHTLLASVDDGKTIIESDESNNEFSASFYFAQALPDLKVTRIYEEEGLSPNKASIIKYTFNNIGLVDSSPTTYAVYVDGSLYETRSLKSIVPQEEYIQSTTLQFESGDHSILISVDPDNTLQEIKETNNQLSQTFTWAGKPDLQVHDLRIPPDTCSEDIVLVEFSLYNLGSSGSGVFSTSLYVNGDLQKTWTDTALASGDYLSKSYSRSFNKGINTLKVIIDEGDQVDETIEYNNELLISPDVGSCHFKNLELMDAVINPSPLLEGQDFEILAEITSTGDPIPDPFTSVIRNEQGEIISFCDRLAPLGTNDSFSCTFDMPGLGVGAHQFTIDLDSNTQITELGNENNSYPLVVDVYPEIAPGLDSPIKNLRFYDGTIKGTGTGIGFSTLYAGDYSFGPEGSGIHPGIDILASNQDVFAIASGTVEFASSQGGWGNVVVIRHEGAEIGFPHLGIFYSSYAHLSSIDVSAGSRVLKGQLIGVSGNTGYVFGEQGGYHLHFQIDKDNGGTHPYWFSSTSQVLAHTCNPLVLVQSSHCVGLLSPLPKGRLQIKSTKGNSSYPSARIYLNDHFLAFTNSEGNAYLPLEVDNTYDVKVKCAFEETSCSLRPSVVVLPAETITITPTQDHLNTYVQSECDCNSVQQFISQDLGSLSMDGDEDLDLTSNYIELLTGTDPQNPDEDIWTFLINNDYVRQYNPLLSVNPRVLLEYLSNPESTSYCFINNNLESARDYYCQGLLDAIKHELSLENILQIIEETGTSLSQLLSLEGLKSLFKALFWVPTQVEILENLADSVLLFGDSSSPSYGHLLMYLEEVHTRAQEYSSNKELQSDYILGRLHGKVILIIIGSTILEGKIDDALREIGKVHHLAELDSPSLNPISPDIDIGGSKLSESVFKESPKLDRTIKVIDTLENPLSIEQLARIQDIATDAQMHVVLSMMETLKTKRLHTLLKELGDPAFETLKASFSQRFPGNIIRKRQKTISSHEEKILRQARDYLEEQKSSGFSGKKLEQFSESDIQQFIIDNSRDLNGFTIVVKTVDERIDVIKELTSSSTINWDATDIYGLRETFERLQAEVPGGSWKISDKSSGYVGVHLQIDSPVLMSNSLGMSTFPTEVKVLTELEESVGFVEHEIYKISDVGLEEATERLLQDPEVQKIIPPNIDNVLAKNMFLEQSNNYFKSIYADLSKVDRGELTPDYDSFHLRVQTEHDCPPLVVLLERCFMTRGKFLEEIISPEDYIDTLRARVLENAAMPHEWGLETILDAHFRDPQKTTDFLDIDPTLPKDKLFESLEEKVEFFIDTLNSHDQSINQIIIRFDSLPTMSTIDELSDLLQGTDRVISFAKSPELSSLVLSNMPTQHQILTFSSVGTTQGIDGIEKLVETIARDTGDIGTIKGASAEIINTAYLVKEGARDIKISPTIQISGESNAVPLREMTPDNAHYNGQTIFEEVKSSSRLSLSTFIDDRGVNQLDKYSLAQSQGHSDHVRIVIDKKASIDIELEADIQQRGFEIMRRELIIP